MSIRAQRFATRTRTWLLIAGLTALLIGIGALIGGLFLYFFAALAVATNVVGYCLVGFEHDPNARHRRLRSPARCLCGSCSRQ